MTFLKINGVAVNDTLGIYQKNQLFHYVYHNLRKLVAAFCLSKNR